MKKIFIALIAMLSVPLFAQNLDYPQLLSKRLKQDSLYTQIKNAWQIEANNYKSSKINSYLNINLSTGSISYLINSDKKKSFFSISPIATISSPYLNNLGLQISAPYSTSGDGSKVDTGFGANFFFDIYSQNRNQMKLKLEQAEYSLSLAEKRLKMQEELIEKKLLNEIKSILSQYAVLLSSRMKLSMEKIKYQQTQAQGYNKNSPKFRTAQLSLMQAERETKNTEFLFMDNFESFTNSFNTKIDKKNMDEFFMKLATSIPDKELPKTESLNVENFFSMQNAKREYENFLKQNKIKLNIFSAQANLKFSMNKKEDPNPPLNIDTQNIETGITMNFPGCKLYTGASFTLRPKDNLNPNLLFSFSVNPLQIYDHVLMRQNTKLSEESKRIELRELEKKLKREVKQLQVKIEQLTWQEKLYNEELGIYKQNALDHKAWFKSGVISESQKRQAELEYQQAVLRKAQANIDSLIFNIEMNENFIIEN